MVKRLKSFLGFFKPKRSEYLLILIGWLLLAAAFVPELVSINMPYSQTLERSLWDFSILLILGTSIGAGLGTFRRNELLRDSWFGVSVVLILLFNGFLFYRESFFATNRSTGHFVVTGWLSCLFGTVGAWAATKFLFVVVGYVGRKFRFAAITRQRLLVGTAVLLFICLTGRNLLVETDTRLSELNLIYNPLLQFLVGIGVLLVGAALPAWGICKLGGKLGGMVSLIYLGTIAGLTTSFVPLSIQFMIGLYAIVFSVVVVGMTRYRELKGKKENRETCRWLWGGGTLSIAILAVVVFWNFSLNALLLGGSTRLELARQFKEFSSKRGVSAQFDIWNPGLFSAGPAQVSTTIEFQPNVDTNCLSVFANTSNQFIFGFENVSPDIETLHIRDVSKMYGSISDSRITYQQLEDILNTTADATIINCQFVESTDEQSYAGSKLFSLPTIGRFRLGDMPAGETGRFLQHIDLNSFVGMIYIVGRGNQLSEKDWRQIVESSQHFPIEVNQMPPESLIDETIKDGSRSQLTVSKVSRSPELSRDYWSLIVGTNLSVRIRAPTTVDAVEKFWDAAFASRGTNWAAFPFEQMEDPLVDADLIKFARKHHWIFEEDAAGELLGALLPVGSAHLSQISTWNSLQSLSMDPRWVPSLGEYDDGDRPMPTNISALGNLTTLKWLDLPCGLWGADYSFLKTMPDLEHLQFDVFVDGTKRVNFGFLAADCPNLKSLVLFGKPSKPLAIEISKLPKLESLKLIDIDNTLMAKGQRDQIQKAIGENISLTIVSFEEDRPDVPAEFLTHVERVRELVREKYLSSKD